MGRRWAGLAVLAALAAAFAVTGGAGAAGSQDSVNGAAIQTLGSNVTGGAPERDQYSVGATSNPDGSNPSGTVTYSSDAPGLPQRSFSGDVSQGCLLVSGNHAAVVGELPPSQQFTDPVSGRLIKWVAVVVEDNGRSVHGQPTDRAVAFLAFDTTGQRICAGGSQPGPLPIDHGNFVVVDAS